MKRLNFGQKAQIFQNFVTDGTFSEGSKDPSIRSVNVRSNFLTLILESLTLIFVMVMNAVGAFDLSKDSR